MSDQIGLFDGVDLSPQERAFLDYHRDNPEVYALFRRFTFKAISAGRTHMGARMVGERIRWYTQVETTDQDYKVNDHYWPFYVRVFEAEFPDRKGFFSKRTAIADGMELD